MSNAAPSDSLEIQSAPEDGAVPKLTELGVGGSATEDGLTIFTDIQVEELEWWWDGVIPKGVYCEVIGLPEAGKSTLMAEVFAHLTTGTPFPNEPEGTERDPTNVMTASSEDHAGTTIKPRLINAGADMERVMHLDGIDNCYLNLNNMDHLDALFNYIMKYEIGFIVLDPISAYFGRADAHKDHVARGMLGPLVKILQQSNCTLCAIRHTTKKIEQAIHAGGGSGGFTAQSRASFLVGYLDSSQEERVIVPLKTNLSVRPPPQGFKLEVDKDSPFPVLKWTQQYPDLKAHDLTSRTDETDPQRNPIDQITDWFIGLLQRGPIPSKDIEKFREERGYSHGTYQRARDALKERGVIEPFRDGRDHCWQLTNNKHSELPHTL